MWVIGDLHLACKVLSITHKTWHTSSNCLHFSLKPYYQNACEQGGCYYQHNLKWVLICKTEYIAWKEQAL
uniref:Macaca fascicularis brain cDNA clone: QflA-23683, similar to human solute carrier organic anion transporter family, member1A2 (SLCO1A2), transcript variant 3, mRNA, RefSeq: NM_005075.2 n=1 Tax=Macaca fascicularis TaxID=9541 RepID=I7GP30_MACFA|nr:unnamed protein product [Macaca fascicularis]